jgi:hypothetical protein
MIVQPHVALDRSLEVFPTDEVVTSEHLFDTAVKALHHPVGLGSSRAGQSVLDAQRLAQLVKLMPAAFAPRQAPKEPVGELLAVVGQNLPDLDRTGLVKRLEEGGGRACALVGTAPD